MEELENQLPQQEETAETDERITAPGTGAEAAPAVTEEAPVAAEELPEAAEAKEEAAPVTEEAAPAAPEVPAQAQEVPPAPPRTERPRRRSPYENSPYLMAHQVPPVQEAPVRPAPVQAAVEQPPRKQRRSRPVLTAVLVLAAIAMTVFVSVRMTMAYCENYDNARISQLQTRIDELEDALQDQQNAGNSVSGTPNVTADGSLTPGQVYARNLKSVVLIETEMATGSGFILTADGYVVTNYHVVEDGTEITVVMDDRSTHPAVLVGYEASNDVALLKVEGDGFPAVTLGSSDDLIVGDQVAAIGNPLGELTSTLTVGYVSAKERDVSNESTVISMIQTDCAINSGNSGGPLFNMKGEVVGITTAKYSGMSSSGASIEGIGFAIPMDDARGILEDLMEFGYVKSAYLGVSVYTLEPGGDRLGCLVDSVTPGSCAYEAGVQAGDIIVGLGGKTIRGYTDLTRVLREFEGGEATTITVYRDGQGELELSIILDAKPREQETTDPADKNMPENGSYEEWYNYFFGE